MELLNLILVIYTINVKYNGDSTFLANSSSASFIVSKAVPVMDVICENISYGDNETILVLINQTGNVTITVNDTVYKDILIEDGVASLIIPNLSVGTYSVSVSYGGNDNYTSIIGNSSFTVDKLSSYLNISGFDTFVGSDETLVFELPNDASGNITVYINSDEYVLLLLVVRLI